MIFWVFQLFSRVFKFLCVFEGHSGVDMDFAGFSGVKRVLSVFFKVVKDFSSLF